MSSSAGARFSIKMCKLLVGMGFVLHYLACFWYLIGDTKDGVASWSLLLVVQRRHPYATRHS